MDSNNHYKVVSLYSSKISKNNLTVDENGIIGDKHYAIDPLRSILLTSTHSYKMAKDKNIDIKRGELGENILLNFNPYLLDIGTKLLIGETILEITQMSTLCNSLSKLDSKLPKLLKNDRGIFAKVVRSGVIKVGNRVEILK